MPVYHTPDEPRNLSLRAEARQRGVTIYRVRADRYARGQGASPAGKIAWHKLPAEQVAAIKKFPLNRRRALYNIALHNHEHYEETQQTIGEYDYWDVLDGMYDINEEKYNLTEEDLKFLRWYHPR